MIGGWLQAGSRADSAVHIGSETAPAADNVVVVISHPRLIARRMAGRLDASEEPGLLQNVQIVVYGLRGERAEPPTRGDGDRFRVAMLSFAQDRREYGETGRGHAQTGPAQGFVMGRFFGRHILIIAA